jgi:hypothetical protein
MASLASLYLHAEELLGRSLSEDEKDFLYICKLTGNSCGYDFEWGDPHTRDKDEFHAHKGFQVVEDRPKKGPHKSSVITKDETIYKGYAGNPIIWNEVAKTFYRTNAGVYLVPWETDKDRFCVISFVGEKRYEYRIPIEQASRVLGKLPANKSLLQAFEDSMTKPLDVIHEKLMRKLMRN